MPSTRRSRVRPAPSARRLFVSAVVLFVVMLVATQMLIEIPVAYAKTAGPPADGLIGFALAPLAPRDPALAPKVAGDDRFALSGSPLEPAPRPVPPPDWRPHPLVAGLVEDALDTLEAAQAEYDFALSKFKKKKEAYKNNKTEKKKKAKEKWKAKKKEAKALLDLAQDAFDDAIETAAATADLSVPMLVQQALPAGVTGLARTDAVVTFGLPFSELHQVLDLGGRPSIAVVGSDVWQARTLATWPDGSVKWALVDAVADVPVSGAAESLLVTFGDGDSGGDDIASLSGSTITLDTGVLVANVKTSGFNVLDKVTVDGVTMVPAGSSAGLVGLSTDAVLLAPAGNTSVVIEENGPARAVVRADGDLVRVSNGQPVVAFTCRITARAQSRDIEVTVTLRNATLARNEHVELAGVEVVLGAAPGANPNGLFASPSGFETVQLAGGALAYAYQAQSDAEVVGLSNSGYRPHIPKVAGKTNVLAEQGWTLLKDFVPVVPPTSTASYPANGWASLRGGTGGITVAIQHMAYLYPAALELSGTGYVSAGLWTQRNAADYAFVWRQHESRTCTFSFFGGTGVEAASNVARRLDVPVSARAADYDYYDLTAVFPYDLLTVAEQNAAYAAMGLPHAVTIANDALSVTRHIVASGPGGFNNHANIERRLAGEWLRHGHGGQFQTGLGDALYKAEWQIERSDDFVDSADPGAANAADFGDEWYSTGFQGDTEHRYREGIILAYYLTGDARYREALLDEVENLSDLWLAPNSRAMASSIRQLALVAEFSGSAVLLDELEERITYHALPVLTVPGVTSWGWDGAPGAGPRGYFAYDNQTPEKNSFVPIPKYATKGFFEASLMPLAYYHAARMLDPGSIAGSAARLRQLDLARYTHNELFPTQNNPQKRLAYVYDILDQEVLSWETFYFHPILLGMAEAYKATGKPEYLDKGVMQIEGFYEASPGNMTSLDSRLDVQHFLRTYLDANAAD